MDRRQIAILIESMILYAPNESTFDVIIMCNVLHEIPLQSGLLLFSETGPIHRSLKSTDSSSLLKI